MVESNPLTAYGHVLLRVSLSISHDLIVIGMSRAIQVEEVFNHLGKVLVKLENVVRLQVVTQTILALLNHGLRLS